MTKDALPDYMTFDRKKIGLDLLTALGLTTAIAVTTTSCDSVRVPGENNSLERTTVLSNNYEDPNLEGKIWCEDGQVRVDTNAQDYLTFQGQGYIGDNLKAMDNGNLQYVTDVRDALNKQRYIDKRSADAGITYFSITDATPSSDDMITTTHDTVVTYQISCPKDN